MDSVKCMVSLAYVCAERFFDVLVLRNNLRSAAFETISKASIYKNNRNVLLTTGERLGSIKYKQNINHNRI